MTYNGNKSGVIGFYKLLILDTFVAVCGFSEVFCYNIWGLVLYWL